MRAATFSTLLVSCFAMACSLQLGTSQLGTNHHAQFAYGSCFFGCSIDEAMMVGTEEVVTIKADAIPSVTVTSGSPAIVSVRDATRSCCAKDGACRALPPSTACTSDESAELDVTVDAQLGGSADLTLVANDGSTFDAVTLTVAEPVGLALTCDNKKGPIVLAQNQTCIVGWTATDASGHMLMATRGVTLATTDVNVVALEQLLSGPTARVEASQALLEAPSVVGVSAGQASITASARQASTGFVVQVTH